MTSLKTTLTIAGLVVSAAAFARPMVLRESQRLEPPPNSQYNSFAYRLAVDGDWAVVDAAKYDGCCGYPKTNYALLYRHDGTRWNYDRVLHTDRSESNDDWTGNHIAMSNGLVALEFNPLVVFKRNGSTFTRIAHPFTAPPSSPDWVNGYVKWSGHTLFVARARCGYPRSTWGGVSAALNPDGTWSTPLSLDSDSGCDESPNTFDFSGNTVVASTYSNDYEFASDTTRAFKLTGAGWTQAWRLVNPSGVAAVRGNEVFVPSGNPDETRVYANDGSLSILDRLRTVAQAPQGTLAHSSDILVQGTDVFRKNGAGKYEHVAILTPSEPAGLDGGAISVSGRRLLMNGYNNGYLEAYAFDLPQTFTPAGFAQFSFENGNAGAWTPAGGEFAVATRGAHHVYRQSSTAGDARSVLQAYDWKDQAIEADITPTAFSGADRWVGLAVRYLDASNHYYVTLRNSGFLELRKKVNGTVTMLTRKAFPVIAGKTYHIALQARGPALNVYVDNTLALRIGDTALTHGAAALVGYRTQADFDNVAVGELGPTTMYDAASRQCTWSDIRSDRNWSISGSGLWGCSGQRLITQSSTAGDARAVVGTATDDQIVQARVRATQFAAATAASPERWFGLTTRYRDANNFYYVSLRNSNTISLRKLVNGAITVLGSAPLTATAGSWYDLRLDAVGSDLRVLVNGEQVLQAVDTAHAVGQGGAVAFKTAAQFDRLLLWQP